ncbi:MAG: carboxypeptidase-like regulatory domain-containing protein, partial [Bacteroidales bacterium]|nr:carboxypeptidase-like regulatory domain-containing protein [Bacteroidales bacterium]
MKHIFLILNLLLLTKGLAAQRLTGEISDPDGNPVPYANVALYQNLSGKLITGTISDTTGKFSINVPKNQELNDLMIVASFIGMINDTLRYKDFEGKSFLNIQLKPDDNLLDEISVTAFKSPIKISGGSILASVEHSVLSKMGSLDQMMNRIPFVSSKDGNMTVFGRGDAVVYLNGRKVLDKNILKQLSPNQIKNVEVITDPDSK